ncbi:MAG TPA: thiolase family protein [Gammaproteobacteria bacterium]|nr:thiolase family protein [Gammaproteobacteria bacterium]
MSLAHITGIGMVPFGKHVSRSIAGMAAEAVRLALADAGLPASRIGIAFFANAFGARLFGDLTLGQNALWEAGINRIPVVNVENACTSGSTAFVLACNAVAVGQAEFALAVGAEKLCVPELGLINSGATELETQLGLVAPASFALRAMRYMAESGTTADELAAVAVKNRAHAAKNPLAFFRGPALSVEQVLASPVVVDPLTKLQCCPNADGAAAVIVRAPAAARRMTRAIDVRAALLCTGSYENPQDLTHWETDYRACRMVYEAAGIGADDVDVVECHDAFTIAEILHYEALGLCAPGDGGRYAAAGHAALGGRVPVNPSGGLLSRGHPAAATGVAQLVELVMQLRGEAGERQVEHARVGVAQCMGGDKAGDTKSCTVAVLAA